jgi:hypothetical protein
MAYRRLTSALHYLAEQDAVARKLIGLAKHGSAGRHTIDALRTKIRKNAFFRRLDCKTQKAALEGKRAIYLNRAQIAQKLKWDANFLEAQYKVLSNHTHPFIYGLYLGFVNELGADCDEARHKIALILYLLNCYVGMTIHAIYTIYPAVRKFVPEDARECARKLSKRFSWPADAH